MVTAGYSFWLIAALAAKGEYSRVQPRTKVPRTWDVWPYADTVP
jgi:hypothetical protein